MSRETGSISCRIGLAGYLLIISLFFLLSSSIAGAKTVTWTNTLGGDWNLGSNWSSGASPKPIDEVVITASGLYTISMADDVTVKSVSLGAGTLSLNSGTLLIDPSAVSVTGTVSPAGETVSITSPGGTTVSFIFPPGAVSRPLDITLTLYSGTGNSWLYLGVEPDGVMLDLPVTIQVEMPSSVPNAERADLMLQFVGESDTHLLPTTLTGSLLEASSLALGLPGFVGGPATGMQPTSMQIAPSAIVPLFTSPFVSPAMILQAIPMSLATRMAVADSLLTVLVATNRYRDALELATMIESILMKLGDPALEAQIREWSDRAYTTACGGFANARTNMNSNKQNGHPLCIAEAQKFEIPVLSWVRFLMMLTPGTSNRTCAGFTDNAWMNEISSHMANVVASQEADIIRMWTCDCQETPGAQWTAVQLGRCHTLGIQPSGVRVPDAIAPLAIPTTDEEWDHLADTVVRANIMASEIAYIGLDATPARTDLVDPHFEFARKLAWDGCRQNGSTVSVEKLLAVLPGTASLQDDGQYCGTLLNAASKDAGGTVIATLTQSMGGVSAGVKNMNGSIDIRKDGKLDLSGPIQSLHCPATASGGSEALSIKLDGTEIQAIQSSLYLDNPLEIDIASALTTAYPGNPTPPSQTALTIERTGAPCNGFWGSNPSPLLTLNLSVPQPKIAFARNGGIYVINPDGSGETQLTSGAEYDDNEPSWSPDRTRLAFSRGIYDATSNSVYNIYVMNADGSGITPLKSGGAQTSFADPAWSPDGSKIAFCGFDTLTGSGGDIYVMNSDGSGIARLTTDGSPQKISNLGPSWSPDGTSIAFYRFDGLSNSRGWDIYVMNSGGAGQTAVTTTNAADRSPSWSPDGAKIAFSRYDSSNVSGIFTMNADGTGEAALTSALYDNLPSWSPDSSRIAFTRAYTNIYIINSDGSGLTFLTSGYGPAW